MRTLFVFILIVINSIYLFSQVDGNLLKIQGQSSISDIPEDMTINIPVMVQDSIYLNCSDRLMEKYNKLLKELIQNGIEKEIIKSDRLQITESYNYGMSVRKFEGYNGIINVIISLKYDPSKLNQIVRILKNKDLSLTYNVTFQLSEEQKNDLLQKSIENAIKDAKNKAKIISGALGLKLIEIKEINFGYVSPKNDELTLYDDIAFSMAANDSETDIILYPQKMEINKSIGIIWSIGK